MHSENVGASRGAVAERQKTWSLQFLKPANIHRMFEHFSCIFVVNISLYLCCVVGKYLFFLASLRSLDHCCELPTPPINVHKKIRQFVRQHRALGIWQ